MVTSGDMIPEPFYMRTRVREGYRLLVTTCHPLLVPKRVAVIATHSWHFS